MTQLIGWYIIILQSSGATEEASLDNVLVLVIWSWRFGRLELSELNWSSFMQEMYLISYGYFCLVNRIDLTYYEVGVINDCNLNYSDMLDELHSLIFDLIIEGMNLKWTTCSKTFPIWPFMIILAQLPSSQEDFSTYTNQMSSINFGGLRSLGGVGNLDPLDSPSSIVHATMKLASACALVAWHSEYLMLNSINLIFQFCLYSDLSILVKNWSAW